MAVQQNKKSPSKRGHHRSHDHVKGPTLSIDRVSFETHLRHHMTPKGFYRGRRILKKGED